jgi:hypothetical protein
MRIFDRVDPRNVDRRQWQLWMLSLTVMFILVVGIALLMYPTAFSNDLIVSSTTKLKVFVGFCALSVLLVGYLLDRQVVISQLRKRLAERKQMAEASRESEARLKEAEHVAHVGSSSWDVATDTTTWSDELYGITGRDPHQPPPDTPGKRGSLRPGKLGAPGERRQPGHVHR